MHTVVGLLRSVHVYRQYGKICISETTKVSEIIPKKDMGLVKRRETAQG